MEYLIFLRFVHIVSAIFWGGSVMYLALFVAPAVRALGPEGGKFMQQLSLTNRMPTVMTTAGTLTVLAGLLLMERISNGFTASWFGTGRGMVTTIGGILAIIGYLEGMLVSRPSVGRMAAIGKAAAAAGGPPTAEQVQELQKLRTRLFSAINVTAWMVLGAAIAMSVARYF